MNHPYAQRPWLDRYPEGWPRDLTPRFADMMSAFSAAVSQAPDRIFLRYFAWSGTFADADAGSDALAAAFLAEGVAAGDRVSIIGQNTPNFAEAIIACWKVGAVPVPCNPMYRAGELSRILADATPTLCYSEEQVLGTVREALAKADLAEVPVIAFSAWDRGDGDERALPPRAIEEVRSNAGGGPTVSTVPRYSPHPENLGLLLYTSGTTGMPKGVMLSHQSIAFNAQAMGEWGGVGPESIVLGVAPLFHITGFVSHLCLAIVAAAKLVLTYRFQPDVILDAIRRERPTYTVAAITAFNALMNAPGATQRDFSSLTATFSGGAAIPPSIVTDLRDVLGIDLRPCYGMTETCSPTHAAVPGARIPIDRETGALSIGVPTFSTEAFVADDNGHPVPLGRHGEL
ncbi:class I adenylate-forming enzyme family protein [Sphingomonas tagetis]|uniref:class I adenylate-forming enzyme family protein n=1 Tax=Sphingomonas tagetis TaxID=2949092 RepID=UPI00345E1905